MCSLRVMSLFTVLKQTLPPNSKLPISLLKFKLNLVLYTFSLIWPKMDVGDNPQLTMEVMVKIQDKHTTSNTDLVLHTHTALSKW